jgi:hypothetical protein
LLLLVLESLEFLEVLVAPEALAVRVGRVALVIYPYVIITLLVGYVPLYSLFINSDWVTDHFCQLIDCGLAAIDARPSF